MNLSLWWVFFCNHLTYRLPFQFVSCIPNFEEKKTIDVSSGHCPPNGPNKRNSRNCSHKFLSILDAIFLKLSSSVRCRRTAFTFQIKIVFKINVNNYNRHTNNAVTLMIQFQGHRSHNQKFTIEMCLLFALQKSSGLAFQNKLFHFIIICEVFLFSFINIILIFPFSSIKYVFIHFKCITHLHILPVNRQLVYLDLDRGPDSMTFRLYSFQCPRNCNQFYYGN